MTAPAKLHLKRMTSSSWYCLVGLGKRIMLYHDVVSTLSTLFCHSFQAIGGSSVTRYYQKCCHYTRWCVCS